MNVDKGFIAAIADAITKKTLERVHNMKIDVEGYLDKHLEDIILLGLGIKRDYGNQYKFERANGFGGLIVDYVTSLARNKAIERAEGLLKHIVEVRGKEILTKVGDDVRRIYVDAYQETLHSLIKDHLENNEVEFREKLTPVIKETAVRLEIMSAKQLKALISSMWSTNKVTK